MNREDVFFFTLSALSAKYELPIAVATLNYASAASVVAPGGKKVSVGQSTCKLHTYLLLFIGLLISSLLPVLL